MENQEIKSRKHGFQLPFHYQQVIAWVIFAIEVLISYTVFLPLLGQQNKLIIAPIFAVLQLSVIVFAYKATKVDPTDPAVYKQRITSQIDETLKHQCTICRTRVGARSKHCGQCNRCVELFDHHCFWLNNCIGKGNYKSDLNNFPLLILKQTSHFLGAIFILFLESLLKISLGIFILVGYFKGSQNFVNLNDEMSIGTLRTFVVLIIVSILLNILLFGFFLQLLILHFWLIKNQMTTYELIIQKRQQKMQKETGISVQQSTQDNQHDHTLDSVPKQQKYQSKIVMKVDQSSANSNENSFVPLSNSMNQSGLKKPTPSDLAPKTTLDDRSPGVLPFNQATQSSSQKEHAPHNKLGLGENSFEISEISDVEDDTNQKAGFHKMVSRAPVKKEHNLHNLQNNSSHPPNSARNKGPTEQKQSENPAMGNSMGNMEDEDSARGTFDMSEKLRGLKNKTRLSNPLLHVLKLGFSFEVDEDMTHYLATPSARDSQRPKHFEIDYGEKMPTDPDNNEAEKYSTTPQKLLFNDSPARERNKFDANILISTNKVSKQ